MPATSSTVYYAIVLAASNMPQRPGSADILSAMSAERRERALRYGQGLVECAILSAIAASSFALKRSLRAGRPRSQEALRVFGAALLGSTIGPLS
jgi:NO-binding membrane sensor protein with MHYT domain